MDKRKQRITKTRAPHAFADREGRKVLPELLNALHDVATGLVMVEIMDPNPVVAKIREIADELTKPEGSLSPKKAAKRLQFLSEWVEDMFTKYGGFPRIYRRAPNDKMLTYALDRVLGKAVPEEEKKKAEDSCNVRRTIIEFDIPTLADRAEWAGG